MKTQKNNISSNAGGDFSGVMFTTNTKPSSVRV